MLGVVTINFDPVFRMYFVHLMVVNLLACCCKRALWWPNFADEDPCVVFVGVVPMVKLNSFGACIVRQFAKFICWRIMI